MAIDPHNYTKAVHAGVKIDPTHGAIAPVIVTSTTYRQSAPAEHQGYDYSRADNPTREQLESALAELEGGDYGLAFSSGLAAEHAIMGLFRPGDTIVVCDDVYGGTRRLFSKIWEDYGLNYHFCDLTDQEVIKQTLTQLKPKAIWIETPTNPTLRIVDLTLVASLAKEHHAMVIVDNTFATPMLQQPLALGADIVVHSSTKYLGGHTDVIGGAIITSDPQLYDKLKFLQYAAGSIPSPFDCYLLLRSLSTLALRMNQHCINAEKVASYLSSHPQVSKVIFPGLSSHPQHKLAKRQMHGFSGMVSFYLQGSREYLTRFCQSTKLFILAESLGSTKSLINHPASMTHASVSPKQRKQLGITDSLLRLSVGIEDSADLIDDLRQALKASLST